MPAIFGGIADTQLSLKQYRQMPGGSATLALPISFATFLMPKLHGVFAGGLPSLQLRILEGSARHVEGWVLSGEADLGIIVLPCSSPRLKIEPLYSEDLFLIHKRSIARSMPAVVGIERLAELPLVLPPLPHGTRELIETLARMRDVRITPVAEIDSPHTQKYMILNHGLFGVSSKMVYQDELADGTIIATPLEPSPRRSFAIATLDLNKLPPGTRSLMRLLRRSMPA
ncbi:hypothetical protein BH09PSE6_BH09PSE6_08760 [soil metagenome]